MLGSIVPRYFWKKYCGITTILIILFYTILMAEGVVCSEVCQQVGGVPVLCLHSFLIISANSTAILNGFSICSQLETEIHSLIQRFSYHSCLLCSFGTTIYSITIEALKIASVWIIRKYVGLQRQYTFGWFFLKLYRCRRSNLHS